VSELKAKREGGAMIRLHLDETVYKDMVKTLVMPFVRLLTVAGIQTAPVHRLHRCYLGCYLRDYPGTQGTTGKVGGTPR